jgi:hypothetical protein
MECVLLHENGDVWQIGEQHNPRPNLPGWRTAVNLGGRGLVVEPFYTRGSVMGRGADNRLYRHENGRWLPHDTVGQFPTNAVHDSAGLGRGLDNRIWVSSHGSEWVSLGGDMRGRPDMVDPFIIAAKGADNALWVSESPTYDGVYGQWQSLEGQIGDNPAIIALPYVRVQPCPSPIPLERVMVLARGANNPRLWMREKTTGGAWSAWRDLGGDFQGSPSVAQVDGRDEFYCFVRGRDNHVHCLPYENGRWGAWQNWGGGVTSDPVACSLFMNDGGARIRVFALGEEGALWEKTLVKN